MSSDAELDKIKQEMLKKLMNPAPKSTFWRPGGVMELTDANFNKAIAEADKPVLIDFWAEWCGPCKMMAPVVHQLAQTYTGKAYFAKLNVDFNKVTAAQFGVMSIPNFIVFKNGKAMGQTVGAVGRQGLDALIARVL